MAGVRGGAALAKVTGGGRFGRTRFPLTISFSLTFSSSPSASGAMMSSSSSTSFLAAAILNAWAGSDELAAISSARWIIASMSRPCSRASRLARLRVSLLSMRRDAEAPPARSTVRMAHKPAWKASRARFSSTLSPVRAASEARLSSFRQCAVTAARCGSGISISTSDPWGHTDMGNDGSPGDTTRGGGDATTGGTARGGGTCD